MNWIVFVPLPFLVAYLVKCQDQRAAQKEGGKALRELSREDRRRVGRALWRGEPIEETRLVTPTLAWTRSTDLKCRWGDVFLAVWLGTFLVSVGLAIRAQDWRAAAIILLGFDFFALVTAVGLEAKRRAKNTELATLARSQGAASAAPQVAYYRTRRGRPSWGPQAPRFQTETPRTPATGAMTMHLRLPPAARYRPHGPGRRVRRSRRH